MDNALTLNCYKGISQWISSVIRARVMRRYVDPLCRSMSVADRGSKELV